MPPVKVHYTFGNHARRGAQVSGIHRNLPGPQRKLACDQIPIALAALTVAFELDGQQFTSLNGGPHFKFTEAVSFVVNCEAQEEVDNFWEKLSEGGGKVECGWLKDKFGLSSQIVPIVLIEMLQDKDPEKSQRLLKAMLQMKKLDMADPKKAYQQR